MELYLLTNLEKKKKPCMSGCLDFCLFLESTVFRGFYSASENGRTKILQPVRERMGMLEIHLASLLKPCKGGKGSGEYSFAVPYEGLSRLPQHCGSWKPEGIPPMPEVGAHQVFLLSRGSCLVSFMLFPLELVTLERRAILAIATREFQQRVFVFTIDSPWYSHC